MASRPPRPAASTPTSAARGRAVRAVRRASRSLLALALTGGVLGGVLGAPAGATAPAPLERVVVTGPGADLAVRAAGGQVLAALPLLDGVLAELPRRSTLPAGLSVVPDRPLSVAAAGRAQSASAASTVRATLGLGAPAGEGRGVTVAVVDTGVADVPALAGRVEHVDVDGDGAGDAYGHGTFIAGLVAGSGAPAGPAYAGVAPGARVLDVRVADADGSTDLGRVLRGLQVVADRGDVDVLNLSLSSRSPLPWAVDPLTRALERLQERGTVVVVPAGNDPAEISSPGVDPHLLTVGSLDEAGTSARGDDTVSPWSGRGGHGPDLVAPGASLVSTLAPGSAAESAQHGAGLPAGYGRGSGTSFSAGVLSGAVAALLAERDLSPEQVAELVDRTAYRVQGLRDRSAAGAGGLDLAAARSAKAPKDKDKDKDGHRLDDDVPGSREAWEAFVRALLDDDADAAARHWAQLSPQARHWVARHWAATDLVARHWAARHWAGRQWPGGTAEEWTARQWAARQWAARQWSLGDWSARHWSARQWSARHWADLDLAARHWSARQWSARQWSARQWSARDWS